MGEMTERALRPLTEEEYLALERESPLRHELLEGIPYAMAGAGLDHNLIVTNLVALLKPLARAKGCRVYSETVKLKLSEDTFYYPDVMVVCGPKAHPLYETAPCLVVEVLSPSTEAQDRREKLARYLRLPKCPRRGSCRGGGPRKALPQPRLGHLMLRNQSAGT
jgi:Uma2 family endonuclease